MNVGQTLLHHAKEDELVFGGKRPERFGDVEIDENFAAFGKAGDIPLQSSAKVAGFQRWRVQKIGEGANLSHDLAVDGRTFVERLANSRGQAWIFANDLTEKHLQASEILGESFVEGAGNAVALLIRI